MPSTAYEKWREFAADPEDLLRRFEEALDAADPDPHALSRAVIVGLAAAWEAYVEELAREVVALRRQAGRITPGQQKQVTGQAGKLNNPMVKNVEALLLLAFGAHPWSGVRTTEMREAATRRFIDRNQTTRHQIAHGVACFRIGRERLAHRVRQFAEVVESLDQRAQAVLAGELGANPW